MEKFLKGLLWKINPVYTLIDGKFLNSFPVLYADKMISTTNKNDASPVKLNEDVITFRESISRSRMFSKSTITHSGSLNALNNYRDIIAHCDLSTLSEEKLEILLKRDFYRIAKDFFKEAGCDMFSIFGDSQIQLAKWSAEYEKDQKTRIDFLLKEHLERWESKENDSHFVTKAQKKTDCNLSDQLSYFVECPACHNEATLFTEIEYDWIDRESVPCGLFIRLFKCCYCGLELDDDFDYFSFYDFIESPKEPYHDHDDE